MVALSLAGVLLALAAPFCTQVEARNVNSAHPKGFPHQSTKPSLGSGAPPLRIMALGASITYGKGSTTGNGYRGPLREKLCKLYSNPVNMVGTRRAGTMRDNDVEGWPGLRVDQIRGMAGRPDAVPLYRPNVVLLNAGTNDALQSHNVSAAGARMEALLRDLYCASPRAVVVLSTLLPNRDPAAQRNVLAINAQYCALAARLAREGRKIVLADMQGAGGPSVADLLDGTHPNDQGYVKMANVWVDALKVVGEKNWLVIPEDVIGLPNDGGW